MSTSVDHTKRLGTILIDDSYDELLMAYAQLKQDMMSNHATQLVTSKVWPPPQGDAHYDQIKIRSKELADKTIAWCQHNPLSVNSMPQWSPIMSEYLVFDAHLTSVETLQPVAEYLNFIIGLDFNMLSKEPQRRSPVYEDFCDVMNALSTSHLDEPHPTLKMLTANHLVDFNKLLKNLESSYNEQFDYAVHILNNVGEYTSLPEGILMRSLLSLSLAGVWTPPQNDVIYHLMWDVLDIDELDVHPSKKNLDSTDLIDHMIQLLPKSASNALEYYRYYGEHLLPEQQNAILSMNLAHLRFPDGLATLIQGVYENDHEQAIKERGIHLIRTLHPEATKILEMYMALYPDTGAMLANLSTLEGLQSIFESSDALRNIQEAKELVASWTLDLNHEPLLPHS